MTTEILLAGFGGQGVLFAGKVLAYCGLMDSKELSWLPSYGPEMRGGTANCSVCISDEPIGSPLILNPDILIAMNGPAYEKFVPQVKPNGIVIADSTLVDMRTDRTDLTCFYLPSTELSETNNLTGGSNIILLGKFIKECNLFTYETIEKAIEKVVPPAKVKLLENNLKAIKLGMSL